MRGASRALLLVILVCIGTATIASYLGVSRIPGRVATVEMREDLYTMENALRTAKQYSATALRYSVYQACYDALRAGTLSEEEMLSDLADKIKTNLDVYTKGEDYVFLTDYKVSLPAYEVDTEKLEPEKITAVATGENFAITKGYEDRTVSLEKNSELHETINTACWGIYQRGAELDRSVSASVQETLNEAVKGLPETGSGENISRGDASPDELTDHLCGQVFRLETKKAGQEKEQAWLKSDIEDDIRDSFSELETEQQEPFRVSASMSSLSAAVGNKIQDLKDHADGTYDVTCSFTYTVNVKMEYWVNDTSVAHPVWNGTHVAFEFLKFHSLVESEFTKQTPSI